MIPLRHHQPRFGVLRSGWLLVGVLLALAFSALGSAAPAEPQRSAGAPHVVLLEVQGVIGPAMDDYVGRALHRGAEAGAAAAILRLDTPGGLTKTTRAMIHDILESPIPVVVYVAPEGSRATSAGTYLLMAAHVAAMAPATHVGAATPVRMGGGPGPSPEKEDEADETPTAGGNDDAMSRKMVSDAVAYLQSLAELRGRNVQWAEKAVREGASLTSSEALEKNVVERVAADVSELLDSIHGMTVQVRGEAHTLQTRGVRVEERMPDWRTRLLALFADPNVGYILMMIGIYGLIFEFSNPGSIGPGILGAICLVLALFAFHLLPINYAGLGLIGLGIVLMVVEAFVPSFGALGLGGVAAFVIGSILLVDTDVPHFELYRPLIWAFAAASLAICLLVVSAAVQAWRRPVTGGQERLVGKHAVAMEDFNEGSGWVHTRGERWQASTDAPVKKGQSVTIVDSRGLRLFVSPGPPEGTPS